MHSIGEVSRRVGIKVPTLRYYEQAGLIPEPDRTLGKQRRYSERDLERLGFIKHARQLGFSLAAIRSLLQMNENEERDCDKLHQLATTHLAAVQSRIALLKDLEQELLRIASGCDHGETGECYVIESLANHDWCETDHDG